MTADEVRDRLRKALHGTTQGAWGIDHGVAQAVISDVLNGRRDPTPPLCAALGLRRVVSYEPIDERPTNGSPAHNRKGMHLA